MTDFVLQFSISSANVDWLLFIYSVEVQLMLFVKRFLFFPPVKVDSSLAVLDLLLAQSTPPIALWACRLRLFAPRDSARPAAPLVGEMPIEPYNGGCPLGYGFGYFFHKSGFAVGFAWLWGRRRKPCVKQSQNGPVLDLFAAVNGWRKSFRRKLHRSENWTEWNNFEKIVKPSCIVPKAA